MCSNDPQKLAPVLVAARDAAFSLLQAHDSFDPFAFAVGHDGQLNRVSTSLDSDDQYGIEVIDKLIRNLQEDAARGSYRATAVARLTHINIETGVFEAVLVTTEQAGHANSTTCYCPFRRVGKRIEQLEPRFGTAGRVVFDPE